MMTDGYKDQISAAKKVLQGTPECMIPGGYQTHDATPHADLIRDVLDPRIPKGKRERAAAKEIERLKALLSRAYGYTTNADDLLPEEIRAVLAGKEDKDD